MRKRIVSTLLVLTTVLLTACGSSQSQNYDTVIEQNVKDMISQCNLIPTFANSSTLTGIYYAESIYPGDVHTDNVFYDIGSSAETKYARIKSDFKSAVEWYKYAYESGPISPADQYKANLDAWVNYLSWHENAIPILTEKKGVKGLYRYIESETGDKNYEPKQLYTPPYDEIQAIFVFEGDYTIDGVHSSKAYVFAFGDKKKPDVTPEYWTTAVYVFDNYELESSDYHFYERAKEEIPKSKELDVSQYEDTIQAIIEGWS